MNPTKTKAEQVDRMAKFIAKQIVNSGVITMGIDVYQNQLLKGRREERELWEKKVELLKQKIRKHTSVSGNYRYYPHNILMEWIDECGVRE